jgi:pyruvate/2-oxoglutarate dehydrogenase complex dihydrolipoamide dehydrogenase (E3) component
LILAVGTREFVPNIPGIDLPHVHFCYESRPKSVEVGKNVVIIGAGHVGGIGHPAWPRRARRHGP